MADFSGNIISGSDYITGSAYGGKYEGVLTTYEGHFFLNRAYNTAINGFVCWKTPYADVGGSSYPGPGTFSSTTNYSYILIRT